MTIQQLIDTLNSFQDKNQQVSFYNDYSHTVQIVETVGTFGDNVILYCEEEV